MISCRPELDRLNGCQAGFDAEIAIINDIAANQPITLHRELDFIFGFSCFRRWLEIGNIDLPLPILNERTRSAAGSSRQPPTTVDVRMTRCRVQRR